MGREFGRLQSTGMDHLNHSFIQVLYDTQVQERVDIGINQNKKRDA